MSKLEISKLDETSKLINSGKLSSFDINNPIETFRLIDENGDFLVDENGDNLTWR